MNKEKSILGVAWVVRDSNGMVLLHNYGFHPVFKTKGWEWALESMKMKSLHLDNITFGATINEIIKTLFEKLMLIFSFNW